MKKLILAALLIIGSLGYVFVVRASANANQQPLDTGTVTTTVSTSGDALPVASAPVPVATSKPTPTPSKPAPAKTGAYTDGTYTGSVADAYYGNIQVAAVISGGRLENVKILQYPNDRGTSIEINRQALPYLVSEAISAQSAHVDAVSGASDTSAAFVESLGSALAKAKA